MVPTSQTQRPCRWDQAFGTCFGIGGLEESQWVWGSCPHGWMLPPDGKILFFHCRGRSFHERQCEGKSVLERKHAAIHLVAQPFCWWGQVHLDSKVPFCSAHCFDDTIPKPSYLLDLQARILHGIHSHFGPQLLTWHQSCQAQWIFHHQIHHGPAAQDQ